MWALRAARVFDGTRLVDPPTVLVEGDAVVAVGAAVPPDVADGDVVDVGAATVLPGLVDCHQHLVFDGDGPLERQVAGRSDEALVDRATTAARRALAGGVTTLRDLGDRGFVATSLSGGAPLPTVVAAGPPITPPGGHCWYLGGECADRSDLARAVAERAERGCAVIKIMVTGGALTPSFPLWQNQFEADDVRLVVEESHARGLPVAAHCHGNDGIALAIDVGVDSIEHCSFFDDRRECTPPPGLLDRLAASGIAVSATWGVTSEPPRPAHWDVAIPRISAALGAVHRAGGVVVVGTDAGIYAQKPHDVLPFAMPTMIDAGFTPLEALRALTSVAADVCRRPERGRLAAGLPADIVVVDGDPLTDPVALRRVTAVWTAGVRVPAGEAPVS